MCQVGQLYSTQPVYSSLIQHVSQCQWLFMTATDEQSQVCRITSDN